MLNFILYKPFRLNVILWETTSEAIWDKPNMLISLLMPV